MRARRLIRLAEQDKETKVEAPDLSNVLDGWITHWSGEHVEYECPTMEDGVLQVFEDRSWHWKVRGEIVDSGNTYQSLAEFLKDNLNITIEKINGEFEDTTESLKIKEQISADEVLKVIGEMSDAVEHQGVSNPELAYFMLNYLQANSDDIAAEYHEME